MVKPMWKSVSLISPIPDRSEAEVFSILSPMYTVTTATRICNDMKEKALPRGLFLCTGELLPVVFDIFVKLFLDLTFKA